jgi:hypothetical protein
MRRTAHKVSELEEIACARGPGRKALSTLEAVRGTRSTGANQTAGWSARMGQLTTNECTGHEKEFGSSSRAVHTN